MPNELQNITFAPVPTAGSYTLAFNGQTTGDINYNAPAAPIRAALEALSTIGAGNIWVSGEADTGEIDLTFAGLLANTNVPQTTCDASGLTGQGTIGAVSETTAGINPSGGTQAVTIFTFDSSGDPNGGPIAESGISTYTINGQTVEADDLPTNDSQYTYGGTSPAAGGPIIATSIASGSGQSPPGSAFSSLQDGDGTWQGNGGVVNQGFTDGTNNTNPGTAEVQSLPYPVGTSGTFTLASQTLAYNCATSEVQSALDTALGAGVTTVTQPGGTGTPFTITWNSAGPQSLLTDDGSSLTQSVTATPATTQPGGLPVTCGSILKSAMISSEKVYA